jgi:sugar phosphate permease
LDFDRMLSPKETSTPQRAGEAMAGMRPSRTRYYVLLLGFVVAFVMYLDRACVGTATPMIMREFGLDKIAMGWSTSAFNWMYALFQVPGGWLADRFGSRLMLAGAIAWWSAFTAATGISSSAISLAATRGLFGMGEAAAWPAASRALLRWTPAENRAFGQGFQHSGSRLGAAMAPTLVIFLMARFGWRAVFYSFGACGILVAIAWYAYYRDLPGEHRGVNAEELRMLGGGSAKLQRAQKGPVPWRRILHSPDLWCLSVLYFCYGWVLWIYLQWLPTYLVEVRHFQPFKMGLGASLPLLAATVTNVAGGWISDKLARLWGDLRRGRVVVSVVGFAIAGIAILPGVLARDAATGLACLTIAMAGLELTVAVSWALCLDIAGDFSGSVTGVMNTLGNLGGAISAVMVGYLATLFGWTVPFLVASGLCAVAALLATRIDPNRSAVAEWKTGKAKA